MAGYYELEQKIKENLTLVNPTITTKDVEDATRWARFMNAYIGSLDISVLGRLNANLKKYNAMYIQAVGKELIQTQQDIALHGTTQPTTAEGVMPHVIYNQILVNSLKQVTQRLSLALL